MPHTCTIVRGIPATYDTPASSTALYTSLPCAYIEDSESETTDTGGTQLVTRSRLRLPRVHDGALVDVRAGDHITSVVNQNNEDKGAFAIDGGPIDRDTHLVVNLRRVS